jgi:PAS domain S-box-containing protein
MVAESTGVFPHYLSTRALLAAIVESSDDAILSKNLDGTITSWNSGAERIFGYKASEIVGRSILQLIPEELQSEEREILARLRAGERIEHYETVRVRKDGERLELSLTISPIKNEAGVTVGASKVARDVSERRKMERLLIQSEKLAATGRMAATIAHEINNPLEAVMNLIYLARSSPSVDAEVQSYLTTAEQEIERVSLIARQALGHFRETNSASEFQVNDLLLHVLAVYEPKLLASGVRIDRTLEATRMVRGKRGELTQVFSNLLSNAADAMPDGGVLTLKISEVTGQEVEGVLVEVGDNGPGVPVELRDRVFEAFFTTKQVRGTGIGLWISRQFIERHGGTLRMETSTEEPTRGTRMRIFLPFRTEVNVDLA